MLATDLSQGGAVFQKQLQKRVISGSIWCLNAPYLSYVEKIVRVLMG